MEKKVHYNFATVAMLKKHSIDFMESEDDYLHDWEHYQKEGWKCVNVEITVNLILE